ncbi:MAG: NYN domain-containing protein, partial [Firmicutes bacterium]|nr:NYN domain-containing protein [Bacillota bacterium]
KTNVAVFVDYDNVYWTLMNRYRHDPDHEDPARNLFDRIWEQYGLDNIRMFKAYADFEQVDANLTSLQKKRIQIRHVYANGKNEDKAKNASDIELSIDAMETSYSDPNISCYVFVTADSDMIPIMSRMLYRGKYVELFYVEDAIAKHTDIRNYAHQSYDLLQFLHVDVSPKNPGDYVEEALTYISEWHAQPANKSKNLGPKWLRDGLADYLAIPSNTASQVIDLLHRGNYIREELRTNEYGTHKNIILNVES